MNRLWEVMATRSMKIMGTQFHCAIDQRREPSAVLPEQRAFQFSCAFHLPQRIPAMLDAIELVESANPGQQG